MVTRAAPSSAADGVPQDARPPRAARAPLDYEHPRKPTLAQQTLAGSAWTVGGYIALNFLRLGTNLVLVRLLAPDVFGLVAWLATILTGLQMFSDVGIGPAIIQSPRGEEDRFLRTAYTVQVLRGFALFAAGCALTLPLARFYGMDSMRYLIPVVAFAAVIEGFRSTAFFRMNRQLRMRELTLLEMTRTTLQSVMMVAIAWYWPTVWALVIPMLSGILFEAIVTHFLLLSQRRDGFGWDRDCARLLFGFGKWVFFSTLLTFVANSSDKLIFAKVFTFEELGIYYIALVLATLPTQALLKVGQKVVFPAYSQVAQALQKRVERGFELAGVSEGGDPAPLIVDHEWQQGAERFRRVFTRVRRVLLVLGAFAIAGLIATGPALVDLLYPPNYAAAGWMLQLLAAGAWFQILEVTNGSAMLALGQPRWVAFSMGAKVIALAALIPILAWQWGFAGAVTAVAAAEVFRYGASVVGVARLGVGLRVLRWDLLMTAAVAGTAAVGFAAGRPFGSEVTRLLACGAVTVLLWTPLVAAMWRRWHTGAHGASAAG